MKNEFNPYEEDSSQNEDVQKNEAVEFESSSEGETSNSMAELGLENVESYAFDFSLGEDFVKTDDEFEDSSELAPRKSSVEEFKMENEQDLKEAWFGSFDASDKEFHDPMPIESVIGTDDRVRINSTSVYPWRAICSLLITTKTNKNYIGTGWFIGPGTVVTAGHCVYIHNEGGWAKSIKVMPGRNGSSLPYGAVTSSYLKSVTGWTRNKDQKLDYGAIILPSSNKLGNRTGWFGYANLADSSLKSKYLNLSGYPGDKPSGTQWYHSRRVDHLGTRKIYYKIDTYGGQSGAPVWYITSGKRYGVGIHAYGTGSSSTNSATRIVKNVFNTLKSWKQLGS